MASVPIRKSLDPVVSHSRYTCVNDSYTSGSVGHMPQRVQLKFDDVQPFDDVRDRYQAVGVRIESAVAIAPSNPIFHEGDSSCVLMPEGNQASFAIAFQAPVQRVHARVMGVRGITLAAYNAEGHQVGQVSHDQLYLQVQPPQHLPWRSLEVLDQQVSWVVLSSSVPFILGELSVQGLATAEA